MAFQKKKSIFCQILRLKNQYILIKISMSGRSVYVFINCYQMKIIKIKFTFLFPTI